MTKILGQGMEALRDFVRKCVNAGGTPLIKTKYGGKRLEGNAVIVACWGKKEQVPGGKITGIPSSVLDKLEKETGDWKWIIQGSY